MVWNAPSLTTGDLNIAVLYFYTLNIQGMQISYKTFSNLLHLDCCSSASSDIELDGRSGQDAAAYLARLIERLCLNPSAIDRRKLCILAGHFVWKVFVDIVVS